MILFFSGTGNSRYAARLIAKETGDRSVSMNELIKTGEYPALVSDKPFVFVCPTYAWRIPRVVERFIRRARFEGSRAAYFVLTCGGETENAARYARKTCREAGLDYMGLAGVVMPENYIALFAVPDREQAEAIVRRAVPSILEAARLIKAGRPVPGEKVTLKGRFMSRVVNAVFYPFVVSARGFRATQACTGCGKCAEVCPLNNIGLAGGRPRWGGDCTHCMACICLCPAEAIEYKKRSLGKPRYHLEGDGTNEHA